jgi:hypothetical protein
LLSFVGKRTRIAAKVIFCGRSGIAHDSADQMLREAARRYRPCFLCFTRRSLASAAKNEAVAAATKIQNTNPVYQKNASIIRAGLRHSDRYCESETAPRPQEPPRPAGRGVLGRNPAGRVEPMPKSSKGELPKGV